MRKFSLRQLLLFQFLLASLLPLLVLFFWATYYASHFMQLEAEKQLSYIGQDVARDVDQYLVNVQQAIAAIAAHIDSLPARSALDNAYLDRLVASYPYMTALTVTGKDARVTHVGLRAASKGRREDLIGIDMSRHHQLAPREGSSGWVKPHYSIISGDLEMDYRVPLQDGFLSGMVTLSQLQRIRETLTLGREDQLALIDNHGFLVVHSDLQTSLHYQGQRYTWCELVQEGLEGEHLGKVGCDQDTGFIEGVYSVPSTGWLVWVGRPLDEALHAVSELKKILVPTLLGALVIALGGAWFTRRHINSPLKRLANLSRRLPEENYTSFEQFDPQSRFEEIDQLFTSQKMMARGIAEREASLLESESKANRLIDELYSLFDGLPDSLVWFDSQRQVRWANVAAAESLSLTRYALMGKTCSELECDSPVDCRKCPVTAVFEHGKLAEGLVKTEESIYGVKAFPIHDAAMDYGVVRLLSDVTEKYHLRQETLRNHRMVSLGELSAGIAHEINNPIGLIQWQLPLLGTVLEEAFAQLDKLPGSEKLRLGNLPFPSVRETLPEVFREVEDGARRIKSIVDELRDFVHDEEGAQGDLVDLNEIVHKAVRFTRTRVQEATHDLRQTYAEGNLWVFVDAIRVEQVVVNLLINACEALGAPHEVIEVETGTDSRRGLHYVTVRDEGCGIAEELLERVQDPFFSTKRGQGGTGLGLSISSRIAQQFNGKLQIKSSPGEGTVVRVEFPLADPVESQHE